MKTKGKEQLKHFLLLWGILLVAVTIALSTEALRSQSFDRSYFTIRYVLYVIVTLSLTAIGATWHYYGLYQKYFASKKYVVYTALLICGIGAMVVLDAWSSTVITADGSIKMTLFTWGLRIGLWRVIIWNLPFAMVYCAIRVNINLRKRKNELERQQLKSSLMLLRSQLEPHFLFNTLNTIYATAQNEKAFTTAGCIEELSELFRYSIMEANTESVPVQKELKFIEQYLHLQRMRIGEQDNVVITTDISWDHVPATIAPMLLVPIVENAFKYGVSYDNPSGINIALKVKEEVLHLSVTNTVHTGKQEISHGTGIINTQQRLDLLYKGKYTWKQEKSDAYKVILEINLNR